MFNWTSSASSSPTPAPPRSVTPGGRATESKPPTPPPESPASAALDSALTAATHALSLARPATTEDDFELIDWSAAADPTTPAELQSTDARILALTNAVAQLTAVLQAESATTASASAPVSPASSAHSATAPGAFPESPQVSCHGRMRPAASAPANANAAAADPQAQALDQTLRRLDSRLARLESLVTHALTSVRCLYPDGSPFLHPLTVRDLHAWGTQLPITSPNTTVAHVKQELRARYAQWVPGCRLVWAGLVLQDEQFVSAVVPAGGVVIIMGPAAGEARGARGDVGKGCHVQGAAARKSRDM